MLERDGLKVVAEVSNGQEAVRAAEATQPDVAILDLTMPSLNGLDALLATVQMPAGIPVATMAIGAAGARTAGILAAQILAGTAAGLERRLSCFKEELPPGVERKAQALAERMAREGF